MKRICILFETKRVDGVFWIKAIVAPPLTGKYSGIEMYVESFTPKIGLFENIVTTSQGMVVRS